MGGGQKACVMSSRPVLAWPVHCHRTPGQGLPLLPPVTIATTVSPQWLEQASNVSDQVECRSSPEHEHDRQHSVDNSLVTTNGPVMDSNMTDNSKDKSSSSPVPPPAPVPIPTITASTDLNLEVGHNDTGNAPLNPVIQTKQFQGWSHEVTADLYYICLNHFKQNSNTEYQMMDSLINRSLLGKGQSVIDIVQNFCQ